MYMKTTTMVHVRVDEQVKAKASKALASMGLSVSDAVRVLLARVAAEKALPFEVKAKRARGARDKKDLDTLNRRSDSLNREMADTLSFQEEL